MQNLLVSTRSWQGPAPLEELSGGFESHLLGPVPALPALVSAGAALSMRALVGQMLTGCSQWSVTSRAQGWLTRPPGGVAVDQPGQQRVPGQVEDLGGRLAGVEDPRDPLPRISRARPSRTVPAARPVVGSLHMVGSARERRMSTRFLIRAGGFVGSKPSCTP
jgi:hypothetical protein